MTPGTLAVSDAPLVQRYDVALLDLDGVVYVGADGIPGAASALARARAAGMRLAFVTNNALRTPQAVAAHLRELGVEAAPEEVVTSAQAAARVLAERLPAGARVLVVGGPGLRDALRAAGLGVVTSADDQPVAVAQGYSPDTGWRELAEAAVAIGRGALWLATNLDSTVPSSRGPLPGNGSMVAALRTATGTEPLATGKPDPAMHRESVLRSGARQPIVVGDRLDTDIEGAARVGCDSLLVLTGVATPAELLAAPPDRRPTYLAAGLDGLLMPHPAPQAVDGGWRCGGWVAARSAEGGLLLSGPGGDGAAREPSGATGGEPRGATGGEPRGATGGEPNGESCRSESGSDLDALRALCATAWSTDSDGSSRPATPAESSRPDGWIRAADGRAAAVLGRLRLDAAADRAGTARAGRRG